MTQNEAIKKNRLRQHKFSSLPTVSGKDYGQDQRQEFWIKE